MRSKWVGRPFRYGAVNFICDFEDDGFPPVPDDEGDDGEIVAKVLDGGGNVSDPWTKIDT